MRIIKSIKWFIMLFVPTMWRPVKPFPRVTKTEEIMLELLRKGEISQGKTAELLRIDRHTLFDLMKKYNIPVIDMTGEELNEELSKEIFSKHLT